MGKGNPAWGHGFHKGRGKGRIEGGAIVTAVVGVVAGGLTLGRKWVAKRRAQSSESPLDSSPGAEGGSSGTRTSTDD